MASMTVEQLIEEIEVFIDNCRPAGVLGGSNMIKVNREELLAMFEELRMQLPREINQGKDIVRTQEARLAQASAEAERILSDAAKEAEQLIDQDELVSMANMRAQQILDEAEEEAYEIVEEAKNKSFEIQTGALLYTQNVLGGLETMFNTMIEQESEYFSAFVNKLKDDYKQIIDDKREIDIQLGSGFKTSRSKEDFENRDEE